MYNMNIGVYQKIKKKNLEISLGWNHFTWDSDEALKNGWMWSYSAEMTHKGPSGRVKNRIIVVK